MRFVGQQEAAMSEPETKLDGPDFAQGVPFGDLAEGTMIVGHVAGEAVVLARTESSSRREVLAGGMSDVTYSTKSASLTSSVYRSHA
jgi:hypothetical protein